VFICFYDISSFRKPTVSCGKAVFEEVVMKSKLV